MLFIVTVKPTYLEPRPSRVSPISNWNLVSLTSDVAYLPLLAPIISNISGRSSSRGLL